MSKTPDSHEIRKFLKSYEALGLLIEFLTRSGPFAEHEAGKLVKAVKNQLATGHHVCAYRDEVLIGYCGWILTSRAVGQAWLDDNGTLTPIPEKDADAAALTIVQVGDGTLLRPLIRKCRDLNPNKKVYFKRNYTGNARETRKQSVENV